ncbi:MAG: phenylalanine--tRNA ligase subunit beta [Spirochaetes bacterium]|nr:phenylalanine--tRNA ligase subunit beta [Spirochaetota bacterium]
MPKIEVKKKDLNRLLEKSFNDDELEKHLECAKAELDDITDDMYKIELNDTNRPDLWTSAGIARQINQYLNLKKYSYSFFHKKSDHKIIVDKNIKNIRPFIVGFGVKEIKIDEDLLLELIQNQEKFAQNFGKKRADIAIGIYKLDRIKFPIHYKAIKPESKKFIPLGEEKELNLKEILIKHPKGIEYGSIIKDHKEYPLIFDSNDNVLSLPPVINSRYIGEVETKDKDIFIELTGTNLTNLLLVANIFAYDLVDRGCKIMPVEVEYPYDTDYKRSFIVPYDFNNSIKVNIGEFDNLVGFKPKPEDIKKNLNKMGYFNIKIEKEQLELSIPGYRNDIMHMVDIVEDYVIGNGYNNFQVKLPSEMTIGHLSLKEQFSDKLRDWAVGMGFQEVLSNILTSTENVYKKMDLEKKEGLQIANPMTESYNILRNSIIPGLLEMEATSAKSVYPHKIFEIGDVGKIDKNGTDGHKTSMNIGFLSAHPKTNFSEMRSYVDNIMYYAGIDQFTLKPAVYKSLIKGRSAEIMFNGQCLGYFGEMDPNILENWDINMPCSIIEIFVNDLQK